VNGDKHPEQRALLVESKRLVYTDNGVHLCSVDELSIDWFVVFCCRQELVLLDNEIAFNEAVIEEREQGIQEIQQQIGEVHEIFKDLAVLVHDQGNMIGKTDSNSCYAKTLTYVFKT